ncbi:hypothetical protein ACIRPT_28045 [Streptomyces sp. NPDC101227]|uniref:hypothetical protein n=1 Tax=Streptomyces sp. NPDC101227 TaxID=3366136 RepID=UPI0037FA0594
MSARTAAMSALTANLALGPAPIRVNLIAAGFVDTPPIPSRPRVAARPIAGNSVVNMRTAR